MQAHFGRIRLDEIIAEWEDSHPINPRLLAAEMAATLRTLAPASHSIQDIYASAFLSDQTPGSSTITHGALADYFDSASQGNPSSKINTNAGPIPAAAVMIWRQWINALANEASQRAAFVAGIALPANEGTSIAMAANSAAPVANHAQQPPLSGSEPGYLKMRQALQRSEGERSAAEQLETALSNAQRLEAENAILTGRLRLSEADLTTEREARGAALIAYLAAEERVEQAEAALAAAPSKIAGDLSDLGRALGNAAYWFSKAPQRKEASSQTCLLVVAGLLELLLDRQRPNYNQDTAADAIAARGWRGVGKRQANGVFAESKKTAKDARAEATAKAAGVQDSNATPPT